MDKTIFDKIPDEMKTYNHWVLWKSETVKNSKGLESQTKVPYNLRGKVSVMDESALMTFENCVKNVNNYTGIGFVLNSNNPFSVIDLDLTKESDSQEIVKNVNAVQKKVFEQFKNTYSELSPGNGLHIIFKGGFGGGRRSKAIEIYPQDRFMTMTGKTYINEPITDCTAQFKSVMSEYFTDKIVRDTDELVEPLQNESDNDILVKCGNASNAEKFAELYNGNWENIHPTQSQADFSLINHIAFYTKNLEQIRRIFRASRLGQRDKAKRNKYIDDMSIKVISDTALPDLKIDFSLLIERINQKQIELLQKIVPVPKKNSNIPKYVSKNTKFSFPDGLIGEIAQFILDRAHRPVPEIALAGAIGFMSGICGRSFNISGSGLNNYIILMAETGRGKEGMSTGIDTITSALSKRLKSVENYIGPEEISSGQALLSYIFQGNKSFVSIVGEFGLMLREVTDNNKNPAMRSLYKLFLNLYQKSGKGSILKEKIHADFKKNTGTVESPAFSILGEGTTSSFYRFFDENLITSGLLPRFLTIKYDGPRVPLNENAQNVTLPDYLADKILALIVYAQSLELNNNVLEVEQDKETEKLLSNYGKYCDKIINESDNAVMAELRNRAHLKVLKVSALCAVGRNTLNPVINKDDFNFAKKLVDKDMSETLELFTNGNIGMNETSDQITDMQNAFEFYFNNHASKIKSYGGKQNLQEQGIITYTFLSRRLLLRASFRNSKNSTFALKNTLEVLIDRGDISEVDNVLLKTKYKFSGKGYMVNKDSDLWEKLTKG